MTWTSFAKHSRSTRSSLRSTRPRICLRSWRRSSSDQQPGSAWPAAAQRIQTDVDDAGGADVYEGVDRQPFGAVRRASDIERAEGAAGDPCLEDDPCAFERSRFRGPERGIAA